MERQSGLGTPQIHKTPDLNMTKIGKVYSSKNFLKYGKIEVVFLDYGRPAPVWVIGDVDRKPEPGDQVLVGYIDGRKDSPYLVGFVKNFSHTTNFIRVEKDRIRIQLPTDKKDVKEHMTGDSKLSSRAYIDVTASGITINHPTGKVKVNSGAKSVARKGDSVSVYVPEHGTCTGTITEGSSKLYTD